MWTRPLLGRLQHAPNEIRCECQACGAHSYAPPATLHVQRCGNCQSIALAPLGQGAPSVLTPRAAGL